MTETKAAEPAQIKENKIKGALYALTAVLIGAVLWVVIWRFGFVASLVAWLIAACVIKFYREGAGTISRSSLRIIIPIIIGGVLLSFVAGMASDFVMEVTKDAHVSVTSILLTPSAWQYFLESLIDPGVLSSYAQDFLIAVAFGALGSYGTIKALIMETKVQDKSEESK